MGNMRRTITQWVNCNPRALSLLNPAAGERVWVDAKEDIMELAHENRLMRKILRQIGFPRRGTEEFEMDIYRAAELIQSRWTLHDLDQEEQEEIRDNLSEFARGVNAACDWLDANKMTDGEWDDDQRWNRECPQIFAKLIRRMLVPAPDGLGLPFSDERFANTYRS